MGKLLKHKGPWVHWAIKNVCMYIFMFFKAEALIFFLF